MMYAKVEDKKQWEQVKQVNFFRINKALVLL